MHLFKHHHTYKIFQRNFFKTALVTSCFFLFSCNSATKKKPDVLAGNEGAIQLPLPIPVSKEESARLYKGCSGWYDSVLKTRGFNGGIVVAKNGYIVFESYNGTGHIPGKDFITDSTSFHIASVSKTFTAMAVLKLWQDGNFNIDDELSKFFPSFSYAGITVRTLLNHRSGLPNYVHFMENMGWNKKINISNEDVLNFLVTRKTEIANIGTPNTRFNYCNTNYALLALLIEKVSGKKYGEYLQQTFFTPLDMKHTFVYNHASDSSKVNLSYDWRSRPIPFTFLDVVYGDKNIYSTPRDLLTWDRALSSGILLTKPTLDEAYAPYSNEKPGIRNYGLGWRMNIYPDGKKMIYHNGWWHGNNATFIRLLQDSATIIVLGNKFNTGIYHAKDLADLFGDYYTTREDEDIEPVKNNKQAIESSPASDVQKKTSIPLMVKPTGKKGTSSRKKKN